MYKKETCAKCNENNRVSIRTKDGKAICYKCNYILGECEICQKYKKVHKRKSDNKILCDSCRKKPNTFCDICDKRRNIAITQNSLNYCKVCFNKTIDKREVCILCERLQKVHKRKNSRPLCCSCSKIGYKYKKKKCSKCGRLKRVNKNTKNGPICSNCDSLPVEKCSICDNFGEVYSRKGRDIICKKCYKRPKKICSECNRNLEVYKYINKLPVCRYCIDKERRKYDQKYRIVSSLRSSLRRAFYKYSKEGKKYSSKKYGIDYIKIFEHLGECPGNIEDYHIDHIIPLCVFNFDNPIEVKAAFYPTNHQWMLSKDNLSKNGIYNIEEYNKYIKEFKEKLNNDKNS